MESKADQVRLMLLLLLLMMMMMMMMTAGMKQVNPGHLRPWMRAAGVAGVAG